MLRCPATLLFALGAGCAGCGDAHEHPPLMALEADGSVSSPPPSFGESTAAAPCRNGDLKTCVVHAPARLEVSACAVGVTVCTDGVWGPCQPPDRVDGGLEALAADAAPRD